MSRVWRPNMNWSNSSDTTKRERERERLWEFKGHHRFHRCPLFSNASPAFVPVKGVQLTRPRFDGHAETERLTDGLCYHADFVNLASLIQVLSKYIDLSHSWLPAWSDLFIRFPTDSAALPGRLRASAKYRKSRRRGSQNLIFLLALASAWNMYCQFYLTTMKATHWHDCILAPIFVDWRASFKNADRCIVTAACTQAPGYDWCVCLEVFEHVPKHLESQLVLASDSEINFGVTWVIWVIRVTWSHGGWWVMLAHGVKDFTWHVACVASVWPVWPRWSAF